MSKRTLCLTTTLLWGLLACALPAVMEAEIIRTCTFGAPGDGCVFDLHATDNGTLKVATKASTSGDRWRVCIVQVGAKPATCNIGTGSTSNFTGLVQKGLSGGKEYEVFVVFDALPSIPDPFPPTSVEVQFWGPAVEQGLVNVSGPRQREPVCGNSILDPGEECEPPGGFCRGGCNPFTGLCVDIACQTDCTCPDPFCGDLVIDPGEQCDPPGSPCATGGICDTMCSCQG